MFPSDQFQRALEIYEDAVGDPDPESASRHLREAIAILVKYVSTTPSHGDGHHLLGLCWYELPAELPESTSSAERAFRAALSFEPHHQYANLYLGHVLFDTRRFEEALVHFELVDSGYFTERGQRWRVIKNEELKLCCRLRIRPEAITRADVEAVCSAYESDAGVEFIIPRELVVAVAEVSDKQQVDAETLRHYARNVLSMLDRTGDISAQSLQAPIRVLRQAAGVQTAPPN